MTSSRATAQNSRTLALTCAVSRPSTLKIRPASFGSRHAPKATPSARSTSASIRAWMRSALSFGVSRTTFPSTSNESITPVCRTGRRAGSITSFSVKSVRPSGRAASTDSESSVAPKDSSG